MLLYIAFVIAHFLIAESSYIINRATAISKNQYLQASTFHLGKLWELSHASTFLFREGN
jgi:hypothetical protein